MFFGEAVRCRITQEQLKQIEQLIGKIWLDDGTEKYGSMSHFLRCAVNQLIKKEEEVLRNGTN